MVIVDYVGLVETGIVCTNWGCVFGCMNKLLGFVLFNGRNFLKTVSRSKNFIYIIIDAWLYRVLFP